MHMPRKYASHPYWSWHGHQDGCRRRPAVAQPRFCHWTASQAISPPAHVTSGVGGGHRRRHGRCALSLRQILRRATLHVRHGTHMSHCPSSADTHSSLCHLFTHTSTQRHTVKSPLTPPHCYTTLPYRNCLPYLPSPQVLLVVGMDAPSLVRLTHEASSHYNCASTTFSMRQ